MRLKAHIATSAVLSGVLFYIFKTPSVVIGTFLSGIFIDLDHVLEGYLNYGLKFNAWKTVEICENCKLKTARFFLHSYELVFSYVLFVFLFNPGDFWYGIAAGVSLHMLLDNAFNSFYPNTLFFIKRWKLGFKTTRIINIHEQIQKNNRHKNKRLKKRSN